MSETTKITDEDIVLIRKYFQKKCSISEKETFINWITSLEHESKMRKILYDHWDELDISKEMYGPDPDLDIIISQLHRAINIQTAEQNRNQPLVRKIYRYFSRVAAILLLPILAVMTWYLAGNKNISIQEPNQVYAEIVSPPAARVHFELPDGTTGWLNSGSTLKFPDRFVCGQREVFLNGEGYFDVYPNPDKPFIVLTSNARITALGTEFNILDNTQDENIEATLVTGKILVEKLVGEGKIVTLGELNPNQQMVFSRNTDYQVSKTVEPAFITAWKEGKLVFRNEPMNEVIKKMSRWYNVDVEIKDKELEEVILRATFVDETLSEVLKVLKLTASINYHEYPREILPDGSYSKKKITLYIEK